MLTLVKAFLIIALLGPITACISPVVVRPQRGVGFVELDENTDPKFATILPQKEIGWILLDGEEVKLNGKIIEISQPLKSYDRIQTGIRSGALIQFLKNTSDKGCNFKIFDFYTGTIYGETRDCEHKISLTSSNIKNTMTESAYNIRITKNQTVLTVITGTMSVLLSSPSTEQSIIDAGQQVIFTSSNISAPRNLSKSEIQAEIEWRKKFYYTNSINRYPKKRHITQFPTNPTKPIRPPSTTTSSP